MKVRFYEGYTDVVLKLDLGKWECIYEGVSYIIYIWMSYVEF